MGLVKKIMADQIANLSMQLLELQKVFVLREVDRFNGTLAIVGVGRLWQILPARFPGFWRVSSTFKSFGRAPANLLPYKLESDVYPICEPFRPFASKNTIKPTRTRLFRS